MNHFGRLTSPRARLASLALSVALAPAWPGAASAQVPHTIKFVVPVPPGGPLDFLSRLLADQIGRSQGATVVVENRAGAANIVAMDAVAHAPPDGGTILINSPTIVISPQLRKLGFDPFTSFAPICYLVDSPLVLTVNAASPYRTLADLITAARAKPGELTVAAVGPGTPHHIAVELLKRAANVEMSYVPYSGDGPGVNALLGEHVTSLIANLLSVAEQIKAGKLRALATTAGMRIASFPDVPTVAESGFKGFDVGTWFGAMAPAGTPKDAVNELARWFTQALHDPQIEAKLAVQRLYPALGCGEDYAAILHKLYDQYGRVIREANIKEE